MSRKFIKTQYSIDKMRKIRYTFTSKIRDYKGYSIYYSRNFKEYLAKKNKVVRAMDISYVNLLKKIDEFEEFII